MRETVQFLVLGLGSGAVFAALALSVVVVHRASGVINFATGALALYAAYTYAYLRQGALLVMVPGLPTSVHLGGDPGFLLAAAASVAITAVLGGLLHVLVFRPLRHAAPLASAVASIGLMVLFTELTVLRVGTAPINVAPIFPIDAWTVDGVRISQDRVWFAVTVVGLALLLAGLFRFTRFGLVTRAAASSERGAYVSGLAPDRIAAGNWMLGSAVAAIAGILIAPIVPLAPTSYTLFIVPALAAAVLGRFSSVVVAAGAGIVIGMLQSEATYLQGTMHWLPSTGLVEAVPLALILVVLVARARPLPSRGAVVTNRLGRAPRPRRLLLTSVIAATVGAVGLAVTSGDWRNGLITSMVLAVVALSLVVVMGFAGQVSLAQLTLAGTAGFLVGPLTTAAGLPFPLAPLAAAGCAAVLGVVVGLPALRIRGLAVAVVTLALGYAVEALWFRNTDIVGAAGAHVPDPSLFGVNFGIGTGAGFPSLRFGLLCLVVLGAVAVGVAVLRRSALGARMLAVRANERSAAAVGINVVRTKIIAFALGAFIAGLGGCLLAYQQGDVTFDPFSVLAGLSLLAVVYVGGVTSVSGAIVAGLLGAGGLVFTALAHVAGDANWYPVSVGLALVLVVLLLPDGVTGPVHTRLESRRQAKEQPARALSGDSVPATALRPVAHAVSDAPALCVRGITVRYGGVVANADVSFDVPRATITGLIGPNGAGKTTLIDAISGFTTASGEIRLDGDRIDHLPPHRRSRAGLVRTFQAIELYDDLSVRENALVGAGLHHHEHRDRDRHVDAALALLDLTALASRPASTLSQGQRQLVSIARALACRPEVLLLDEPAGGLDPAESAWLGRRLRAVRDAGVTIVLVEHDMGLVLDLCDRIEVLDFGRVLASGTSEEIRRDPAVTAAYLGTADTDPAVALTEEVAS